jgi:CRISPR/Cas system-associated endonuclease/helicase Cas3
MLTHTFAICAYQDSPYLEACIRSLKHQSVGTKIILCTSTPSPYIRQLTERYGLPYYVREGKSDIQADWNFACEKADSRLVTIAHQDDIYHKNYVKYMQRCWEKYPDTTVFTTDCAIIKNG